MEMQLHIFLNFFNVIQKIQAKKLVTEKLFSIQANICFEGFNHNNSTTDFKMTSKNETKNILTSKVKSQEKHLILSISRLFTYTLIALDNNLQTIIFALQHLCGLLEQNNPVSSLVMVTS